MFRRMKADADQKKENKRAARQRAYRKRVNEGEIVLSIRVRRKVVKALLRAERLDDKGSRNRKKVSAELTIVVEEWSRALEIINRYTSRRQRCLAGLC